MENYKVDVKLLKKQRNFLLGLVASPAAEKHLLELDAHGLEFISGVIEYLDHRLDVVEGAIKNLPEEPSE